MGVLTTFCVQGLCSEERKQNIWAVISELCLIDTYGIYAMSLILIILIAINIDLLVTKIHFMMHGGEKTCFTGNVFFFCIIVNYSSHGFHYYSNQICKCFCDQRIKNASSEKIRCGLFYRNFPWNCTQFNANLNSYSDRSL